MTEEPERAAVGLGSNEGHRRGHLGRALRRLDERWGLAAVSSVYETEAVPDGAPPAGRRRRRFLNLCALLEDPPPPRALLDGLLGLETRAGRVRPAAAGRRGDRPLDLDLLLYGERRIDEEGLVVPHPRMKERAFVLVPLAEIAGAWRVPSTGRTVDELASRVSRAGVDRVGPGSELSDPAGRGAS